MYRFTTLGLAIAIATAILANVAWAQNTAETVSKASVPAAIYESSEDNAIQKTKVDVRGHHDRRKLQNDMVPEGFDHKLVWKVDGPTDIEWMPDGKLLVAEKKGRLWVVEGANEDGDVDANVAIDLKDIMCYNGERGLGGVAVHPNFEQNRYIYLYYTYNKYDRCPEDNKVGPINRLSRFVLTASNKVDMDSEFILFETGSLLYDHHNSGDIAFGNDNMIYVTVGDSGDKEKSQDLDIFFGKMIRITDTGDIPQDGKNPYTPENGYSNSVPCRERGRPPSGSSSGARCQEIFARGLRNPFRFAIDPNTDGDEVRYFINDVGNAKWEEISEGGTNFPKANYGYPIYEGPCPNGRTEGCTDMPSRYNQPIYWYEHSKQGGAVTAGAFVPNGYWPSEYDGAYIFADYVFGDLYVLKYGGEDSGCSKCDPPTPDYIKTDFTRSEFRNKAVSMQFGPYVKNGVDTKALYYVTRGYGEDEVDGVFRIAYTSTLNRAPYASISADPTYGQTPLTVNFDGTGSTDADGDELSYRWDFNGDGKTDSRRAKPSYTFTRNKVYFTTLTVNDGRGGTDKATVRIDVGNTPPVPKIVVPAEGTTFAVGDIFELYGTASDEQDGNLPDKSLSWEVRQYHAEHFHPFLDSTDGNNVTISRAPSPEDFFASTNSYLEVYLTATDSNGLSSTARRKIQPRKVRLNFAASPSSASGLKVILEKESVSLPTSFISWENHPLEISVQRTQTDSNGVTYTFLSWSIGGSRSRIYKVPPSAPNMIMANFEKVSQSQTLTFTPTDDVVVRQGRRSNGSRLYVDDEGSRRKYNILIRFVPSGIDSGKTVTSAVLRLYNLKGSNSGGVVSATRVDTDWDEDEVTWDTAPMRSSSDDGVVELGSFGKVSSGRWIEMDVKSIIIGNGPVSFRITPTSTTRAAYSSKDNDNGNAPQLVVSVT